MVNCTVPIEIDVSAGYRGNFLAVGFPKGQCVASQAPLRLTCYIAEASLLHLGGKNLRPKRPLSITTKKAILTRLVSIWIDFRG